jgi:hypothetical protein
MVQCSGSMPDPGYIVLYAADCDSDGQGMIDMIAVGERIHAPSPGNGFADVALMVFDVSGGRGSAKSAQNIETRIGSASRN